MVGRLLSRSGVGIIKLAGVQGATMKKARHPCGPSGQPAPFGENPWERLAYTGGVNAPGGWFATDPVSGPCF